MPKVDRIRVGDVLPERAHTPTILDLFFYNAALWNGHRIHFDERYATEQEGYPGLVVQGPLQGDWLGQCVMEWLGDDGVLLELEYGNRAAGYLGGTFYSGGRITAIDEGSGEVSLELHVRNEAGDVLCPGSARVRLG
ncbi:MAG: hypothetical protein FJ144_10835 [Deltaproteobacteria bacterium]|nr:hypothetical protein [Deltaproteobacteria bacterium]